MMKKLLLFSIVLFISLSTFSQNHFISTWSTATPGAPVIIPTTGGGYNYDVDWENDGIFDDIGVTGNITHNYPNAGVHTIAIRGSFPRIYFNNGGSKNQLLSIEQWGDIAWTSFHRAFFGCTNLVINASDAPDLSNVTDLSSMFRSCISFNQSINHWNTSNITNMSGIFYDSTYNQPLNSWNVSNVIFMNSMFNGATSFNQPLNNWNVSNVTFMNNMFYGCFAFNQPIDNWNVSSVTDMSFMFAYATSFNQPLNSWNVSNVTSMTGMFASTNFNQPLNNWDVSSVTNMRGMFEGAIAFNQPIESWDVSAVTDMSFMFIVAQNFNQSLNNWNVSAVTQMTRMFERASSFNRRLGSWNVSNVTNTSGMFDRATSYNQPMDNWNVSNVTNMSNMFGGATSFDQSLGTWDVSNVTNMTNMFLNVTLSTINYDDTLIAWDALNLQPNVNFHGGFSQYCNSASQRTNIINNDGWTIIDGGQTICGSLSANDFENQAFKLYPNPIKTSFSIETKEIISSVIVIDMLGKTVKTFKQSIETYSIDDLKSGLYFINITTEKGKVTKKLVKE